jgi:hypothetical protein
VSGLVGGSDELVVGGGEWGHGRGLAMALDRRPGKIRKAGLLISFRYRGGNSTA